MRIGIDETGDYAPASPKWHFFTALLPRRSCVERFLRWESSVGKGQRERGEVKGRLLSEEQLATFVNEVLAVSPPIRIRPVPMVPALESAVIADHRKASAEKMRRNATLVRTEGHVKDAEEAERCADWI